MRDRIDALEEVAIAARVLTKGQRWMEQTEVIEAFGIDELDEALAALDATSDSLEKAIAECVEQEWDWMLFPNPEHTPAPTYRAHVGTATVYTAVARSPLLALRKAMDKAQFGEQVKQ